MVPFDRVLTDRCSGREASGANATIDLGAPGSGTVSRFTLRGRHLFLYDLVAISLAIFGAFALRFDANNVFGSVRPYLPVALLPILIQPICNVAFGLYRREWRYASVREMIGIVAAVATASVICGALFLILSALNVPGTSGLPRSFLVLEGLLSLVLTGGGRFVLRLALENAGRSAGVHEAGVESIVYGAGAAGAALGRMALHDPAMAMKVVGFVDDDPSKRGSRLHGVRIFGGLEEMPAAVRTTHARELVVAMPSASGAVVRRALDAGQALGLTVRTVPPFADMLGHLAAKDHRIRPIQVEDLLRREPVRIDLAELTGYMNGATVLVTGAGGSIGSELARQILTLGPRRLIVSDNNEAALWAIDRELGERRGTTGPAAEATLCDVRSAASVEHLISSTQPDVVFHAAALKHVPICEVHPAEAVLTNVVGTRNVLDACGRAGVSRFVLISTDKAVQPVGVMGATKRLAELLTTAKGQELGRPHFAVRFGNVLGSSGSVVPIFEHQLATGLPLTITHPDATRYFMTIPEAVSLILEAGASDATADIFILDMGDPVRIVDLAHDMIRLMGRDPKDVTIVYTGLRPGERLEEQLFYDHEAMEETIHPRILRATATGRPALRQSLATLVPALATAAEAADDRLIRQLLATSGIFVQSSGHPVAVASS
jgi:FlaA1/EpsC-like NDP-sugar epimerase